MSAKSFPEKTLVEEAIKDFFANGSEENKAKLMDAFVRLIDSRKALYGAWASDAVTTRRFGGHYESQTFDISKIPVVRNKDDGKAFLQIATRTKYLMMSGPQPLTVVNVPFVMAIDLIIANPEAEGIVINQASIRPFCADKALLTEVKSRSTFAGRNSIDSFMDN